MVTRRPTLTLIRGGKCSDEAQTVRVIYPVEQRVVRAEPRPDPHPPKAAA